ncbi:MAG: serine protease [Bacteroidetes bacterium]|nr:serine protease [Bacteroidota bacterium]
MKIKNGSFTLSFLFFCGFLYAQSFNSSSVFHKSKNAVFEIITFDKGHNELSYGTGFFIDSNGVGVTNYHVLKEAFHASIRTFDKEIYPIKDILFADEDLDVVKFTIEQKTNDFPVGRKFKYLNLSSKPIAIGEDVFVIGNPEGLDYSISAGIVSAIRKKFVNQKTIRLIQTTAPISHGNSGSPLINKQGYALGVISFTFAEGQNLNFAIVINDIKSKISPVSLTLPLDKNAQKLKYDEYELELIANDGAFIPKDSISIFMGQDKETIKSFYENLNAKSNFNYNWHVVRNTELVYSIASEIMGVYNYYFSERENICDGESYNIFKGKETEDFIQRLFDNGYKRAKGELRNLSGQFYSHYFVIDISPDPQETDKNFVTLYWNPNYHPNYKKRDYKLK